MRTQILLIACLFLEGLHSQTLITAEHQPQIGDECRYKDGVRNYIEWEPQEGVWDLSMLTPSGIDTHFWMDAAAAPDNTWFPTADIAYQNNGGTYTFFRRESDALQLLGSSNLQFNTRTVYSNPMKVMTYPCSLGSTWTDAFTYTTPGSPVLNGEFTWTATREGTLMLPAGTVPDVLMIYHERELLAANGQPLVIYVEYSFRSPHFTCELARGEHQRQFSNGQLVSDQHYFHILDNEALGLPETQASSSSMELWPVPAQGIVNLRIDGPPARDRVQLTVIDATGREVLLSSVQASTLTAGMPLDIHSLAQGLYSLRADLGSHGSITERFIVE